MLSTMKHPSRNHDLHAMTQPLRDHDLHAMTQSLRDHDLHAMKHPSRNHDLHAMTHPLRDHDLHTMKRPISDLRTMLSSAVLPHLSALAALFFPGPCALCGEDLGESAEGGVCVPCWAGLPVRVGPGCERCDLPGVPKGERCPDCHALRRVPIQVPQIIAAYEYREAFVTLHRLLKFLGQRTLLNPLAARMVLSHQMRSDYSAELVVPVPPDPLRWGARRRTTRQLAGQVASGLELPFHPSALRKTRTTPSQTRQTRQQRLQGLRGAFAANGAEIKDKRVLLIDDIVTTGTTVSQAASTLLKAGAAEVRALTLARTPQQQQVLAPPPIVR